MTHDAEPPTSVDDTDRCRLPDVSSLTAAAVLASGDSALGAALRRLGAELETGSTFFAAFANFAPSPDPD